MKAAVALCKVIEGHYRKIVLREAREDIGALWGELDIVVTRAVEGRDNTVLKRPNKTPISTDVHVVDLGFYKDGVRWIIFLEK